MPLIIDQVSLRKKSTPNVYEIKSKTILKNPTRHQILGCNLSLSII